MRKKPFSLVSLFCIFITTPFYTAAMTENDSPVTDTIFVDIWSDIACPYCYIGKKRLEKAIANTRRQMEAAAKELDFIEAARLRDEMFRLQDMLKERK